MMMSGRSVALRGMWVVGAAVLVAALAWIMVRSYLSVREEFRREPASDFISHPEQTAITGLEAVQLVTSAGVSVFAWYVPSVNGAAVILCHGGNADRAQMLPEMRMLVAAGYGVLTFDWPGQGLSGGSADWGAVADEALGAAINWLAARKDVESGRIGGLGFSMGGYIMTQVAAYDPRLVAVILEAVPGDFLEHVTQSHKKWGVLSEIPAKIALRQSGMPYWKDKPVDVVGRIAPRPVFLIWGDNDSVVPEKMTQDLFDAAGKPKNLWIILGAGHGGYAMAASSEYQRRVLEFFGRFLESSGSAA